MTGTASTTATDFFARFREQLAKAIVGQDDARSGPDPGQDRQEHIALQGLRLVDDDEGIVQRASADMRQRQHFQACRCRRVTQPGLPRCSLAGHDDATVSQVPIPAALVSEQEYRSTFPFAGLSGYPLRYFEWETWRFSCSTGTTKDQISWPGPLPLGTRNVPGYRATNA